MAARNGRMAVFAAVWCGSPHRTPPRCALCAVRCELQVVSEPLPEALLLTHAAVADACLDGGEADGAVEALVECLAACQGRDGAIAQPASSMLSCYVAMGDVVHRH